MATPVKAYVDPVSVTAEVALNCTLFYGSLAPAATPLVTSPIPKNTVKLVVVATEKACSKPLDVPASVTPEIAIRQTFTPVYEDRNSKSKGVPATPRVFPPIYLTKS